MWLVAKVVATGMPSAWRKVLYCMEAMKLMPTWAICTGADSGSKAQEEARPAISMAISRVSHRTGKVVLDGIGGISSDTKAPRI